MSYTALPSSSSAEDQDAGARDQDRNLPLANISRIMKKVLPTNVKVSKDAMMEIQKCVSEFISFITSEAGEKCFLEKRKTLNGDDILFALLNMGFDNYNDVLLKYLSRYRESTKDAKPEKKSGDIAFCSGPGLGTGVVRVGSHIENSGRTQEFSVPEKEQDH
jgi:histone H3/H4